MICMIRMRAADATCQGDAGSALYIVIEAAVRPSISL